MFATLVCFVKERSVVSSGVNVLGRSVSLVHLRVWLGTVANSEDVVNVDSRGEGLELGKKFHASISCAHGVATEVAIVCENSITELITVERVPVTHLNVSWGAVIFVVSHTVSNSETFKVWLKDISVVSIESVVIVDVVGEVWYVNSSV